MSILMVRSANSRTRAASRATRTPANLSTVPRNNSANSWPRRSSKLRPTPARRPATTITTKTNSFCQTERGSPSLSTTTTEPEEREASRRRQNHSVKGNKSDFFCLIWSFKFCLLLLLIVPLFKLYFKTVTYSS